MATVILSTPPSSAAMTSLRRLLRSTAAALFHRKPPLKTTPFHTPITRLNFLYQKSHTFSSTPQLQALLQVQNDVVEEIQENSDVELGPGPGSEPGSEPESVKIESLDAQRMHSKLQSLTVKEKKELASYANSLGKNLKTQQIGKSGITDTVVTALVETLEKNELLKLKIHGTCPGELEDVVKQLEEATGSVVVGHIGRTVILYRPSLSKLKAEEKKKLAQRALVQKQLLKKPAEVKRQSKVLGSRPSNRGRRGSSRFPQRD